MPFPSFGPNLCLLARLLYHISPVAEGQSRAAAGALAGIRPDHTPSGLIFSGEALRSRRVG
jgi:hypothetical protein